MKYNKEKKTEVIAFSSKDSMTYDWLLASRQRLRSHSIL